MEQLTCAPQLLRLCSRARSCNCRSPRALEPLVHKKTGHREEEPRAATRGGPTCCSWRKTWHSLK